jgi:hypothetical protein
MSFPAVGDQSGAWLFSAQASIVSISAPIVVARRGDYLVLMAMVQPGQTGEATLEAVAHTAVGKLS